jgi:hypothetical protein
VGVERAMWELTEGKGCMRVVLDREMDGNRERRRCQLEEGESRCQWCRTEEGIAEEGGSDARSEGRPDAGSGARSEGRSEEGGPEEGGWDEAGWAAWEEEEARALMQEGEMSDADPGLVVTHSHYTTANNSFSDAITIASSIADRPAYSSSMQEMGREEQERGQAVDRREADRSMSKRKQAEMMQSEAELIQEITQKRRQRMMQGRRERARQAGEASEGMRLAQMASEWSEGCIWCRAKGEEEEDKINGH